MNRRQFLKRATLGVVGTAGLMAGGGEMFFSQDKFGSEPTGARLERIKASPNFVNGKFVYLEPVDIMPSAATATENLLVTTYRFLFGDEEGRKPLEPIPSVKTNLFNLPRDKDIAVWMGHSTFYLQLAGRRILVDPVFSDYASPVFFINKAFKGSNIYTANDIPPLDILAITHDHWDHLDYATVMSLKTKIDTVICPLGVGAHFEQWGFDLNKLHEEDWGAAIALADDFHIHILPSQHFSGRTLNRNNTLWCSMALIAKSNKVFISGDTGYGSHFRHIGERFGSFDLAFMENGQYDRRWHTIHMLPEDTAKASEDIRARAVIPSHGAKFALAFHKWQEPYIKFLEASANRSYQVLTPKLGEPVIIGSEQVFAPWWEEPA